MNQTPRTKNAPILIILSHLQLLLLLYSVLSLYFHHYQALLDSEEYHCDFYLHYPNSSEVSGVILAIVEGPSSCTSFSYVIPQSSPRRCYQLSTTTASLSAASCQLSTCLASLPRELDSRANLFITHQQQQPDRTCQHLPRGGSAAIQLLPSQGCSSPPPPLPDSRSTVRRH